VSPPPTIDVHAHATIGPAMALIDGDPRAADARAAEAEMLGPASAAAQLALIQTVGPLLVDPELRIAAMDTQGIDVQLVSPSPAHYHDWAEPLLAARLARAVGEGIAELCEGYPQRLRGLGLAPTQHPDVAERALRESVEELGLRGVEIPAAVPGRELGDEAYEGFWAHAEELAAIVFIHPWGCSLGLRLNRHYLYNIVGNPTETTVALSHVIFSGLLDRYPKLRIIAAHGGGYLPFYPGRSDHGWNVRPEITTPREPPSAYLRRLYFDSLVYDPEQLAALIARVGSDRVLLGSDFPFDMGVSDPLERVAAVPGLDKADHEAICGGNAAALLAIERPQRGAS
jgi:aminocarboxymuconate-semialdehyde decarboxylase